MEAGRLIEIAVEDVREKHKALFELIRFTDQQAMALLSLYTTLAVAAASGFGASLGSAPLLPAAAGWALLAACAAFVVGTGCALRVMWSSDIATPGREPDFWQWADGDHCGAQDVLSAYLKQMEEPIAWNRSLNRKTTRWLQAARACGIAAPVLAAAAAYWRAGMGDM